MSITISSIKRKGGNSFLAAYHRQRRLKQGFQLEYADDVVFKENNPFGNNSVVALFNEDIAHQNYLRSIQKVVSRNDKGQFTNY